MLKYRGKEENQKIKNFEIVYEMSDRKGEILMFKKGDYVIYGSRGVCEVLDIIPMNMDTMEKDKLYYVLHPYHQKENKIFTPVDNHKTIMRKIVTKEEALFFMNHISEVEELEIMNDKLREKSYKECLLKCDNREWLKIIKTIYLHQQQRVAEKKKMSVIDEMYLKIAEDNLFSELSVALEKTKEEIRKYILTKLDIFILV